MAAEEEKSSDFYAVMGLKKECTPTELRNAYKKLAMRGFLKVEVYREVWDLVNHDFKKKIASQILVSFMDRKGHDMNNIVKWHPDRCRASSANKKYVEEAKKKFQDIQQAYSVLSDANKRFLYDVGVYNSDDDDDENGMGDFLNEMAVMMNQNKSNENRNESLQDLQQLFQEIFQSETTADTFCSSSCSTTPLNHVPSQDFCSKTSNKRNSSEMSSRMFASELEGFCIREKRVEREGEESKGRREGGGSRRDGRKQKISSGHDVSSRGGISCCKM